MYNSQTYGKLNIEQVPEKILEFYENRKRYDTQTYIVVGTDSQGFASETKIVTAIAVVNEGHGGIYFYEITHHDKIKDIRKKLYTETQLSLEAAEKLVELIEKNDEYSEMYLDCPISIHIDVGNSPNGKTKDLIAGLTGWVSAMGYECEVKPDSVIASTVADRISK